MIKPNDKSVNIMDDKNHEERREWLSDVVRIVILIWSAGLLTASYVRLPSGQKIMDFDPTFIASVFSGSLAGFGIAAAKAGGATNGSNGNNGSIPLPEAPVYARPRDEETGTERKEPEIEPIWDEPIAETSIEQPPVDLEQRVEALEATITPEDDQEGEGFVRPRRGDL